MFDVIMAVAIAAINLFLLWYSVHYALEKGRKKFAAITLGVGVAGILLVGWSARRSYTAQTDVQSKMGDIATLQTQLNMKQQQLDAKMDRIEKNTEQAPNITIEQAKKRAYVVAFVKDLYVRNEDHKLAANLACQVQPGGDMARDVGCVGAVRIIPATAGFPTTADIDREWKKFEAGIKFPIRNASSTIMPGDGQWGTEETYEVFQGDTAKNLDDGTRVIVLFQKVFYTDEMSRHALAYCRWLQPPFSSLPRAWHTCGVHDGLLY